MKQNKPRNDFFKMVDIENGRAVDMLKTSKNDAFMSVADVPLKKATKYSVWAVRNDISEWIGKRR